jgi:hypothetical protein
MLVFNSIYNCDCCPDFACDCENSSPQNILIRWPKTGMASFVQPQSPCMVIYLVDRRIALANLNSDDKVFLIRVF